jgi:iron complex transport system ATP-binding protein
VRPPDLAAANLRVVYGQRTALEGVTVALRAGEMLALCGPNGAGKSTLMRALTGLERPSSGDVRLEGRAAHEWTPRERARRVAYLPQSAADLPGYACAEVVRMGRYAAGDDDLESGAREVERAMARTGTSALAARPFDATSGGERQRVLIARALAQSAPILLFDEPTAHLDLAGQAEVLSLLRDVASDGAAVACVLHDLNLAGAYAARVLLLARGRVAADGDPERALRSDVVSAVFGVPVVAIPHPEGGPPVLATGRRTAAAAGGRE